MSLREPKTTYDALRLALIALVGLVLLTSIAIGVLGAFK